jgi:hypothetical protein
LIAGLLLTAMAAQAPGPVLVDGVAAVVGTEVITLSEVEAEGRVILLDRAGTGALTQILDDGFRARVLEYIVVQELLAASARRDHRIVVRESAVDKAVSELSKTLAAAGGLPKLLEVTRIAEDDVRAILRRDLAVKKLLTAVLADDSPVPAAEVSRFLEERPAMMADRPLVERRRAAEKELKKQRRDRRFSRYVEGLRKETEVRRVADFGTAG